MTGDRPRRRHRTDPHHLTDPHSLTAPHRRPNRSTTTMSRTVRRTIVVLTVLAAVGIGLHLLISAVTAMHS